MFRFFVDILFVLVRMLELVAENAALEDALYYLDQGLTDGVIDVDVFMKEVRRLARKQFVARATMKKVSPLLQKREEAEWEVFVVVGVIAVTRCQKRYRRR